MPRRTVTVDVTCPASTPSSAPVSVDVSFRPALVEWVQFVIPDGHAGTTGIALAQAHGQVIPSNAGNFIEGNDEEPRFEFTDLLGNGNWQALLYNTDLDPHSWQIRFGVMIPEPSPLEPAGTPDQSAALAASLGELGAAGAGDTSPSSSTGGDLVPPGDLAPPDVTPPPDAVPPDTGPSDTGPPADITPPGVTDQASPSDVTPPDTGTVDTSGDTSIPGDGTTGPAAAAGSPSPASRPGTHPAAGRVVSKRVTTYTTEPLYTSRTLPAGGWLPEGARFELKRVDQGQDFITGWRGAVIAPGGGVVIANLSDRPFPDGFGPHYPVVRITSGRWAGRDYYIGHCTSQVTAGQPFAMGAVLAIADQGHVEGGGWVELGPAPGGAPGPVGGGAELAGLWGPVTVRVQTGSRQVPHTHLVKATVAPPRRPATRPPTPAGRRAPTGGAALRPGGGLTGAAPPLRVTVTPRRAPVAAPRPALRVARAPAPQPAPAPAVRRAPAPAARPPARPPVRRH